MILPTSFALVGMKYKATQRTLLATESADRKLIMIINQNVSQEATSITGAWMLDLSRSDNLDGYLQFMGHTEGFIRSRVDGEQAYQTRNVIELDESSLAIYKDTAADPYTERLDLDQEHVNPSFFGSGFVRVTASLEDRARLDGFVVVSTARAPCGRHTLDMLEARQLLGGGHAHIQDLTVSKRSSGEQFSIRRIWVRVPVTREDQTRLLR